MTQPAMLEQWSEVRSRSVSRSAHTKPASMLHCPCRIRRMWRVRISSFSLSMTCSRGSTRAARAAAFCLVPVAITGGIHLDGYADTSDALSSYGDREKKLEILKDNKEAFITIQEGKFHQVKRMFAAVGKEVQYLKRISMGPIVLDDSLHVGECRRLTEEEINLLKNV